MNEGINELLQHADIWRGDQHAPVGGAYVPTGFEALDAHLPGGGWPESALTEILLAGTGIGELRLIMPALARLSRQGRWLAWIAPPYIPYAPALAACGVDLSRVLLVHPRVDTDGLWAVEQALRSGTCGAVLAWMAADTLRAQRRLQLAAEAGHSLGILFRDEKTAMRTSYAALRLRLEPTASGCVTAQLLKRRGGLWAGHPLSLDLNHVAGSSSAPTASGDFLPRQYN